MWVAEFKQHGQRWYYKHEDREQALLMARCNAVGEAVRNSIIIYWMEPSL